MRRFAFPIALGLFVAASSDCSRKQPEAPPVATPSLTLNRDRAPLGSPVEFTYKFVVADGATFEEDYLVMLHVVDTDDALIWTDDHKPPIPTRQWKPGQTVEYTRTVFVPVYPYVGDATLQIGLYSPTNQKRLPLNADTVGQRAYKVNHLQLQPQTENLPSVFKDGWNPTEVVEHNPGTQWQWTKKEASFMFRNPRKDSVLYLDVDNPTSVVSEARDVKILLNGQALGEFTLQPGIQELKKIAMKADQLGPGDNAEVRILVDKTYVPMLVPGSNSKDPRELGIRVFHAFVDPR